VASNHHPAHAEVVSELNLSSTLSAPAPFAEGGGQVGVGSAACRRPTPQRFVERLVPSFSRKLFQPDSLDLAQCNFVFCPVIELRCSRRFVSSHLLGMLQPAIVLQVNRNACSPPGMTSHGGEKTYSTRRLHRPPPMLPGYSECIVQNYSLTGARGRAISLRKPA
jgi:hypothetical protein